MRLSGSTYDIYVLGVRRLMRHEEGKMGPLRRAPVLALLEISAQDYAGEAGGPGGRHNKRTVTNLHMHGAATCVLARHATEVCEAPRHACSGCATATVPLYPGTADGAPRTH